MKNTFTFILTITAFFILSATLISWNGTGGDTKSSGGSPLGYSKDPAGGNLDCNECHADGGSSSFSQVRDGMITSDIPGTGYIPGNTYNITATVVQAGHTKFGFQNSPQSPSGTFLGTLITGTETQLVGSGKYVTHKNSSNTGTGSRTWTYQWTAPATGLGPVTFYGAFNVCDNDGSDVGDSVYTSTLSVYENGFGVSQLFKNESQFSIYPVISNGQFSIENKELQDKNYELTIYNITGEKVYQQKVYNKNETITLLQSSGLYYIWIKTENTNELKKIIIQ